MSKTIDTVDAKLDALGIEHTTIGSIVYARGMPCGVNIRDMYNGNVVVEFPCQFTPDEAIDMVVRIMDDVVM
jgi:hypothetical protein